MECVNCGCGPDVDGGLASPGWGGWACGRCYDIAWEMTALGLSIRAFVRRAEVEALRHVIRVSAHRWAVAFCDNDATTGDSIIDQLDAALDRLAALAKGGE